MFWIFHKLDRKEALAKVNISDIDADPVAKFQSDNYRWLSLVLAFGLPYVLFSDKIQAIFYGGFLVRVLVWHTTWFVNSLAHWLGDDEYANETSAKDHVITALLTLGEGNHGFHHAFPTSYKNGVRWYQYDPTKWLIELGSLFGFCYELCHPPENEVQKARYQVGERKLTELRDLISWPKSPSLAITLEDYKKEVASGKKWLALRDTVFDVSEFAASHPGGTALILSMVGKDPDVILNALSFRHTHTKAARNIMDNLAIARLKS